MAGAVESTCAAAGLPDRVSDELMAYFVSAAEHLRNDTGLPISSAER
jgi:hemoglobin